MDQGAAWCRATAEETNMTWETPAYCEIRLGFEVTAYVYVR
ncbi:pyrroloquinoline quinone precursor peptide PqqA [Aromatoleum anaerobium]